MLISNKVIELNNQTRNEKKELQQDCDIIYQELDPISRLRLNRINSLINDLTLTIGELSGWVYSPAGFTFKSNYQYNPETKEITFDLNRVSKGPSGYEPSLDKTQYELLFITKYKGLLNRLLKLERKRSIIINSHLNRHCLSITYTKDNDNLSKEENNNDDYHYLEIASKEFISRFGEEGINRLVSLLNYLVNPDTEDPIEMYNKQFFPGATNLYIDELFRWAVSFTPRADYVERAITRIKEKMDRELYPHKYK